MPTYLLFYPLQLLAAVRFRSAFNTSAWQTWAYLGTLLVVFILVALATWQQETTGRKAAGASRPATT